MTGPGAARLNGTQLVSMQFLVSGGYPYVCFLQSCCVLSASHGDGGSPLSAGMESASMFAGSLPGLILMDLGQAMVVVCVCFDMVRAMSVPRSHRRYVANTIFKTLAVPSILVMGVSVLAKAIQWNWADVAMGVFVIVMIIFRWHQDKDEDSWWKGKGKKLARWARKQLTPRPALIPASASA